MKIEQTALPGVITIEPTIYGDSRGFFLESYREDLLREAGVYATFVQDNLSRSAQGVLRGMHYQLVQPQGKLILALKGEVFDAVVDVRVGSPTFGQWASVILNERSMRMIYIPPGFAHGFVVLSENADMLYKCTDYYHPASEQGIAWNDSDIAIEWPTTAVSLSARDQGFPKLKDQAVDKLPSIVG